MTAREHVRAFAVLALCVSCNPPAETKPKVAGGEAPKETTLFSDLRELGRPDPPLSALPSWGRPALDTLLASLSEQERAELARGTHPDALAHPLLHWALGGNALEVYAASVETSALSDDWTALAASHEPQPSPRELVEVGNELVRRAARHLLRERAADFSKERTPSLEALRQVATTSELLDARDLAKKASAEWADRDPSAEALAAALRADARSLDVPQARLRLAALRGLPDAASLVAHGEQAVLAAEQVQEPGATALDLARALTRLGLFERALDTLAGAHAPGLAHETELIRAELGASACPHVLRPNRELCSAAFGVRAAALGLEARLRQAWSSGVGRDPMSVEHFLGLLFVAPLNRQRGHDGRRLGLHDLAETLEGLAVHARDAKDVAERFEAIALLAETLREAVRSTSRGSSDERPEIPRELRAELRQRATDLARGSSDPWFADAALASLALSLQDDPLGPDLDRLEFEQSDALFTLGSLQLWTAVADRDLARFARFDALLVTITARVDERKRSGWLLAYAEANAALNWGPSARATLTRLCEPLQREGVPLELRLRAHLDAAVVLSRSGSRQEASLLLSRAITAIPFARVDSPAARDLWLVLSGYRVVLETELGGDSGQARTQLRELVSSLATPGAASPSLLSWLELWADSLSEPGGARSKSAQADSRRRLGRRLGERTRALLEAGVLPLGGAEIDLGYDGAKGLDPRVDIELAFPLVEVPAL